MGFRSWLLRPLITADDFVSFREVVSPCTAAGVVVGEDTAMNLPAVYRSVTLNCDTIASLPWESKIKRAGARLDYPEPLWFRQPTDELTWGQFLGQMQASLELNGNAYALKASTRSGQLVGLYPLAPSAMRVQADEKNRKVFLIAQAGGEFEPVASTAVLHVPGFMLPGSKVGLSPIGCAQQTIGLGFAAEQFGAQFFGSGATLSGVIQMPVGAAPMTKEKAEELQKQFTRKHGGISKSHAVGVLTGGAEWKPLTVTPEDSQFLETRRYTDVQIANLFGVPPEYVTDAEGAKGYVTGLYARQYMWLQTGIHPRLKRLEDAFTALLGSPAYIKANRAAFLAMDPQERSAFYDKGLLGQYMTPNQIREKEDWDPLPDGDKTLKSVQWVNPSIPL
jgi:HK97 family phage portal protein